MKMLTHITCSQINSNVVYVISQEGHPIVLDRNFDMRITRKMPGAKGSIRDCKVISMTTEEGNKEGEAADFLFTVGCDRHLRVFDASRDKTSVNFSSTYLKQKLNSIVFV